MLACEHTRDRQDEKLKVVGQQGPAQPAGIERREHTFSAAANRTALLELYIGARRLPEVRCVR
jgi:hypothetical protein